MAQPNTLKGYEVSFEQRRQVGDALSVALSTDAESEALFDKVIHRLLPEVYIDAPGRTVWFDEITDGESQALTSTLRHLQEEDALPGAVAYAGARHLGLVTVHTEFEVPVDLLES